VSSIDNGLSVWQHLYALETLDLSTNPLLRIGNSSFDGLYNLRELRLEEMSVLERIEVTRSWLLLSPIKPHVSILASRLSPPGQFTHPEIVTLSPPAHCRCVGVEATEATRALGPLLQPALHT